MTNEGVSGKARFRDTGTVVPNHHSNTVFLLPSTYKSYASTTLVSI